MVDDLFPERNNEPMEPDMPVSEVPSALTSYLRNIHSFPPVSDESQKELGEAIAAAAGGLRKSLAGFGFVIKEHIRLSGEVLSGAQSAFEVFTPSALRRAGSNPVEIRKSLTVWNQSLIAFYQEFRDAFAARGRNRDRQLAGLRTRAVGILEFYPLSADYYTEFVNSAGSLFLVTLNTPLAPGAVERIPAAELPFVEEKFFLDASQIVDAVNAASAALRKLQEARNRMLEQNLRLVVSIAHSFAARNPHTAINDVVQEGNLGLLRAIEKFDFELGYKFSTYALWWIRQSISRFLSERSRVIRIPAHMIQTISSMNNAEQQFILENGREPLIEELAMMLEMPVARINAIRKMARQPVSLQAPSGSGKDGDTVGTIEDMLPDESQDGPAELLSGAVLVEQLHHVLSLLPERDQAIIIDRFGLFGHTSRTLTELSERYSLTRERIRQLEMRILKKLRSPEMLKYFDRIKEK
ncbi:MAG: RNA polymerase sigma factor RpoD/SigA [Victivallaceae bacterium]|nr:sigma-70 family RNA polymerase sigma factor [Victivallaceae bacterium]